jgi:hypothetical protein
MTMHMPCTADAQPVHTVGSMGKLNMSARLT